MNSLFLYQHARIAPRLNHRRAMGIFVCFFFFYIKAMVTINGLNKKASEVLKIQRTNDGVGGGSGSSPI